MEARKNSQTFMGLLYLSAINVIVSPFASNSKHKQVRNKSLVFVPIQVFI